MGLLAVLYIVFYEVKRCKYIMTVCGSDCQKGGLPVSHYHVVTGSVNHPVVIVSCFLGAVS